MPNISKITLPNNLTYDIKDATARSDISSIQTVIGTLTGANVVVFRGVSSTALTDGGNQNPTVGGSAVTTKRTGDVYFYGTQEFIYGSDSKWHALGSLDTLGSFAYVSTGDVTITPNGTAYYIDPSDNVAKTGPLNITFNTVNAPVWPKYKEVSNGAGGTMLGNQTDYQLTHRASGASATDPPYYTPEGTVSGDIDITYSKVISPGASGYYKLKVYGDITAPTSSNYTYQPSGTISDLDVKLEDGNGTTYPTVKVVDTIKSAITGFGTYAPDYSGTMEGDTLAYYNYDSSNETLIFKKINYSMTNPITTKNIGIHTSAPTFTGEYAILETWIKGTATNLPLTGRDVYLTGHGTSSGTLPQLRFIGTETTYQNAAVPHSSS